MGGTAMINRIADLTEPASAPLATAKAAWSSGSRQLKQALHQVEQSIAKNPGAALAVAFAVGVYVAWWLKRR
jgi:hypothetical protein